MGTASYVLAGTKRVRGAVLRLGLPRRRPRDEPPPGAAQWQGRQLVDELAARGILIRSPSHARRRRGGARAPTRTSTAVVDAADAAGLARKVARLEPLICVKG